MFTGKLPHLLATAGNKVNESCEFEQSKKNKIVLRAVKHSIELIKSFESGDDC